jgi:3-hydroxymyristoyl/3-hydroxydecanoyl-(acyl carrier protein) dehydratase
VQIPADRWLPLINTRMTPEGRWESTLQFAPSSEWFSGHFDEFPIVPGVVLIALTAEMVKRQGREQGRCLEVSGFSRVRFKQLVSPDDELNVSMAAMPSGFEAELDFHITCRGDTVAQGLLKAREKASVDEGTIKKVAGV